MTSYGQAGGRVPGARREKVRGYLRAANELRQSYTSSIQQRIGANEEDMPGSFPDVDIVRSGDEEMLLFPSYARKHRPKKPSGTNLRSQPGTHEEIDQPHSTGDADYWRLEWERYEDANAVVDVDVRGWIYTPHRGPLNRKNRLIVAVARRLSGIPAPAPSPVTSRSSSSEPSHRERLEDRTWKNEEEAAAKEAENIARHGQQEADAAWRGSYSAASTRSDYGGSPAGSRSSSPTRSHGQTSHSLSDSVMAGEDGDPAHKALMKRQSWNQPANMTKDELEKANDLLMARLRPFMHLPLTNTTITVFFFNDNKSQSKSVTTNESGQFNLRAALDFVPTSVRVLASENLSATEDVVITDQRGVSLVSDIDDTIKHSAIASGAREIFKNTFIRDLGDLTIKGVKEWYNKLAGMGVKMHYVSNSPWQLYPLLRSYFTLAGLPPGSFHLKQYSGMLQGIFEPAAERKKGSMDRIMNDFPDRKFILVGDSGEADLEVYTDVVLAHPGRVLGVFIRDVTTPPKRGFFDQSMPNNPSDSSGSRNSSRDRVARTQHHSDAPGDRPSLPQRHHTDRPARSDPVQEDLIDFSDDSEKQGPGKTKSTSYVEDMQQLDISSRRPSDSSAPPRPSKPSNLRNFSTQSPPPSGNHDRIDSAEAASSSTKKPPAPPKPRRPSSSVETSSSSKQDATSSSSPWNDIRTDFHNSSPKPTRPNSTRTNTASSYTSTQRGNRSGGEEEGYVASARRQISTAYNALPALRSSSPSRDNNNNATTNRDRPTAAPPAPPRRGLTSYPAAAARWATGATGGDPAAGGDGGAPPGSSYNKKEEMWRRRWTRAEDVMKRQGVVLRSWKVGSDVMDECVRIVEKAFKEIEADKR